MKKHKWHKEIKAWADGAKIEFNNFNNKNLWMLDTNPDWNATHGVFRIKPQPKEPQYLYVYESIDEDTYITSSKVFYANDKKFEYIGKIKLEVEDGN